MQLGEIYLNSDHKFSGRGQTEIANCVIRSLNGGVDLVTTAGRLDAHRRHLGASQTNPRPFWSSFLSVLSILPFMTRARHLQSMYMST